MRSAFSLTPKTLDELKFDIESWAETLAGAVPLERLEESYLSAMGIHRKLPPEARRFPLVATEVSGAFWQIEREELSEGNERQLCTYCEAHKRDRSLPGCPFHSKALSIEHINSN